MWLPHARATAAQVAALARQLSSDEEADQMCHAALSNDVHVRDAYLDGLAERYTVSGGRWRATPSYEAEVAPVTLPPPRSTPHPPPPFLHKQMLCKRVDKVTTIWKDYFCIGDE